MTSWSDLFEHSGLRRAIAVALIAVTVIFCASSGAKSAIEGDSADIGSPGKTLTGNYLAARHASRVRQDGAAADFLMAALKQSPDDPVLVRRAYVVLLLDGRVAEAVKLARKMVDTQDLGSLAHIVVAVDDIRGGRFAQAEAKLAQLPETRINSFLGLALKAWALYGQGKEEEARAALEGLSQEDGMQILYHLHAAILNDVTGQTEAAARHAAATVEAEATPSLRVVQLIGGMYARMGDREAASALYRRYLDEHPDSRLLADAMGRLESGDTSEPLVKTVADGAAEALFDTAGALSQRNTRETAVVFGRLGLYLKPDFPALQILVADMLESLDRFEDANSVYASIDASSPLARQARLSIAVNLNRMDRFDEAAAELQSIAKDYPTDAEPLVDLGDILRGREQFDEAVEAYDQAFARIPTLEARHWRLLYARGIALERAKLWPRAESDFLKALEFEPEQPFVLNYLGYSWVEQGLNLDKALDMIERAVELRPNDGYIVDSLGWVYYRLGRYEDSVDELERAVELRPEDPVINDHLGDAYWEVGRTREARFQWRAALALEPDPELKVKLESKLDKGVVKEANAAVHD